MALFPDRHNIAGTGSGYLLHNLLLFGRLLRGLGLSVNANAILDLVQALDYIQLSHKTDFYHAARCLLVQKHKDLPLFDEAFKAFWRKPSSAYRTLNLPFPGVQLAPIQPIYTSPRLQKIPPPESSPPEAPNGIQVKQTYSARERLRQKDFSTLTPDELKEIKRFMVETFWQFGQRRTRRWRSGNRRLYDLRRTLRQSIKYGGEVLKWARQKPKFKPRPLVILADTSGSMEKYSRLLIHFIYCLTSTLTHPIEAFVFSTRLTRITRQIRHHNVDHALHEVSRKVPDWSGGTRIGQALKSFNYNWGRRTLSRGAVVLLISDGWDRGDIELLRREAARLQRSCHRLMWLNPHLGIPGYEPLTRGMHAALPYIDDFLPVHNLASLEDLAQHIIRLDKKRI